MEDYLIDFGVGAILRAIKNPGKKAAIRKAMAKVYRAIGAAYAGDEEFEKLVS